MQDVYPDSEEEAAEQSRRPPPRRPRPCLSSDSDVEIVAEVTRPTQQHTQHGGLQLGRDGVAVDEAATARRAACRRASGKAPLLSPVKPEEGRSLPPDRTPTQADIDALLAQLAADPGLEQQLASGAGPSSALHQWRLQVFAAHQQALMPQQQAPAAAARRQRQRQWHHDQDSSCFGYEQQEQQLEQLEQQQEEAEESLSAPRSPPPAAARRKQPRARPPRQQIQEQQQQQQQQEEEEEQEEEQQAQQQPEQEQEQQRRPLRSQQQQHQQQQQQQQQQQPQRPPGKKRPRAADAGGQPPAAAAEAAAAAAAVGAGAGTGGPQNPAVRRAVRQKLRRFESAAAAAHEALVDARDPCLAGLLLDLRGISEHVHQPREAAAHAGVLEHLARDGLTMLQRFQTSAQGRHPAHLVAALRQGFSPHAGGGLDGGCGLDWATLGAHAAHLYGRAAGVGCMLGPLAAAARTRAGRRRAAAAPAPEVRPVEGAAALAATPHGVAQETDAVVTAMRRALEGSRGGRAPVVRLVLDHASFAATMENVFALSFLVKDQWVRLEADSVGGLQAVNVSRAERAALERGGAAAQAGGSAAVAAQHQFLMSWDMAQWQALCQAVPRGHALMPPRRGRAGGRSAQPGRAPSE